MGQHVHGIQGFLGLVPCIHVAFCTHCSWPALTLQTQPQAPSTLRGSSSSSNVSEEVGVNVLSKEHADAVCGVLFLFCPAVVKKEVVRVRVLTPAWTLPLPCAQQRPGLPNTPPVSASPAPPPG